MKTSVRVLVTLLICLFVTGFMYSAASAQFVAEDTNACGKKMTAEMRSQRALDILEIQNVAGMHEYYHSALMHQEELDNIWSKRDDITWTNNTQKYIGRKDMQSFYADGVKNFRENPAGVLWYHMLCTPVIVVSGDGKTAKAVWQSFGNVSGPGQLQWTEEKYGMDFIKEDGKWKIWHLRTYVEFYTNASSTNTNLWASQNLAAPEGASNAGMPGGFTTPAAAGQSGQGGQGAPPSGGGGGMGQPTETGNYYEGYSENYMPVFVPVPPEPYCTWSDTSAY